MPSGRSNGEVEQLLDLKGDVRNTDHPCCGRFDVSLSGMRKVSRLKINLRRTTLAPMEIQELVTGAWSLFWLTRQRPTGDQPGATTECKILKSPAHKYQQPV